MDSAHAAPTKELGSEAIKTTVPAIFTTKFALAIGEHPTTLKSDKFCKV